MNQIKGALLWLVALSACGACGYEMPATAIEVDAAAQVRMTLEIYGHGGEPRVFLVPPDCENDIGAGFVNPEGKCVQGFHYDGRIYLTYVRGGLWSDSWLTHELLHFIGKSHGAVGWFTPDTPEGMMEIRAQDTLRAYESLNVMPSL